MSLFWTQRKIFWRMFVIRLFWGTIDFHSRKKKYYGSQWCPRSALFPTFFKISSFVFSRTNTFIQVWNYLRVSKWWQNFHFWVNYPFKNNFVCRRRGFRGVAAGRRAERMWCQSHHGNRRHHQLTPAGARHGRHHGDPGCNQRRAAAHHGYGWQRAAAGGCYGMDSVVWSSELKSLTVFVPAGCHSNIKRHHDWSERVAVPAGGAASNRKRHTDRSTGTNHG